MEQCHLVRSNKSSKRALIYIEVVVVGKIVLSGHDKTLLWQFLQGKVDEFRRASSIVKQVPCYEHGTSVFFLQCA